jgi:alpha-aminoadipic semialdehyde synthase
LFDSNLINSILDQLEHSKGVAFKVKDWILGGNREQKTSAVLEIKGEEEAVNKAFKSIHTLVSVMGNVSGATMRELPFGSSKAAQEVATEDNATATAAIGEDLPPQKVFVLGSGMVSGPLLDYLYRMPNLSITLASNNLAEAKQRSKGRDRIHPTELDVLKDVEAVSSLVKEADLVISMVPAPFHTEVAKACITHKKNMITASYVSPAMRSLHSEAADAGIIILSELGLDPGIDHMSAMQMIDEIHNEGGKVDGFYSVCGGLPAPEAANNPLGYKFSWSPRGVLTAGLNDAKYMIEGRTINVDGKHLFQSAREITFAGPSMALEHIPNRDSLPYQVAYKIPEAKSIYRGEHGPQLNYTFLDSM